MNDNEELKKKIEEEGEDATEDELLGEPTTDEAAENEGPSETELPDEVDDVDENMFSSAD